MNLPMGGEFDTPINEHDGLSVGDRITFLGGGAQDYALVTGAIRELYLHEHPNATKWSPNGEVFAEVDLLDGSEARCWFTRDKPRIAGELDGAVGAAPEGALF